MKDIIPTLKKKKRLLSYPRQAHTGFIIGYLRTDGGLSRCIFPVPRWVIFCLNSQERNVFSTIWLMLTCYLSGLGDRGSKKEPQPLTSSTSTKSLSAIALANPSQIFEKQVINTTVHSTLGLKSHPGDSGKLGLWTSTWVAGRGSRNKALPIIFRGLSTRWLNKQA